MKTRLLVYGLGALGLALAALVLVAPALVDTPAARAEIQRRLSAALQGQVSWQSLEIELLPMPRGELRQLRLEIPGKVAVAADELRVYLRLWPLLHGQAEIAEIAVRRPQVRVMEKATDHQGGASPDAVALYRSVLEPLARALQELAPDTTVGITEAQLDLEALPLQLRNVNVYARTGAKGLELELAAGSALWKRLALTGRVEYATLAAQAQLELDDFAPDRELPAATLRAELRTDGRSAVDGTFDARVRGLAAAKGEFALPAGKPPEAAAHVENVDVAQAIALARRKGHSLALIESAEGRVSAKAQVHLGDAWRVHLDLARSDAAVKLAPLPWKAAAHAAQVTITREGLRVAHARGTLGDSSLTDAAAHVVFGPEARLASATGKAIVPLAQWLPWLKTKAPLDEIDAASGRAEVTLRRLALRFDRPQDADFDAVVTPREASATLKMLPAPVSASGGAIQVDRGQVRLDKVAVAMLDARTLLSGTVTLKNSAIELALADGALGEKVARWAMERGEVPLRFEPRLPVRFSAQRLAWAPQKALEADARLRFESGADVAIALAWQPGRLELRRATLKDAHSDAEFGATLGADLIHARFAGTFQGRSIDGLLRQRVAADSGTARGELRVTIDRAQPSRTAGEGSLRVEALDLSWLLGRKAFIERAEVASTAEGLRVPSARFSVEDQLFELSGEGRRTPQGPVVDARIESPGVVLNRLLPPAAERKTAAEAESTLWPLPVSGRIEVKSAFVQFDQHRIEPLAGTVRLEPRRARFEVQAARACGVSFPAELEATPEDLSATVRLSMKDEPLEEAMRCLTGGTVEISGKADLVAELKTHGRRPNLVRNLTGTAQASLREGRVKRFALLGNILSFRDITSMHRMRDEGFPYRSMTARGRFEGGEFRVDEAFFDSDAARLAAHGRVDLLGADSQLTVLVGLLTTVDRIAEAVPIIGDIFGGSMTALPMGVRGDIRDPSVVPLGPRAVSDQLLGIFERTLKLPGKLLVKPVPNPEEKK
jgi:uncharacterized protein involved in outer membrane biogenesis